MSNPVWGKLPLGVEAAVTLLEARVSGYSVRLSSIKWPHPQGDLAPAMTGSLEAAEGTVTAAKDLRAVLTAYAHKIHQPRLIVGDIARAQNASSQAIATRYPATLVSALETAIGVDLALRDQTTSAEDVERAIADAASALDASLQSDLAADYENQLRRRVANEINLRRGIMPYQRHDELRPSPQV